MFKMSKYCVKLEKKLHDTSHVSLPKSVLQVLWEIACLNKKYLLKLLFCKSQVVL